MSALTPIIGILLLSFLCESLVEYFARPFLRPPAPAPSPGTGSTPDACPGDVAGAEVPLRWHFNRLWLRYIAAAVGVALAFAYQVDLLSLAGLQAVHPAIGFTITGIVIGRGANYLNDLVDRYLAPAGTH